MKDVPVSHAAGEWKKVAQGERLGAQGKEKSPANPLPGPLDFSE
jgi:hypothetical protein